MHRLERERDGNRLRIAPGREERIYTGTRSRTIHPGSLVRYDDNIAVDYGDNGYGYTNPQDLVRYDLNNNVQPRHRKDSFEGCRTSRPSSITGYNDLPPKVYDSRDKGPPLSTRGWDRIPGNRASTWEQSQVRMPVPVPGPGQGQGPPPMAPIERPARMDPPFDGEPQRRSSAHRLERPVLHYHDKEPRRPHREEYYETRDEDLRDRRERPHRHERYDDPVEQRGFGLRPERPERPERPDRQERSPPLRSERDRADRPDEDRSEHKHGREALATGLSVASAAFGINAMKRSRDDDRDDRDERDERDDRRRRDYGEEPRRRRDPRDDREPIDFSGRDPKERHASRDERNIPPPPRDIPPPPRDRDLKDRDATEPPFIDLSGRDPKERHASRDERDSDSDHREHRRRSEIPPNAVDSRDESSVSDDGARRSRRVKAEPGVAQAKFNPKDAMDLKALKEALTSKDVPKEPIPAAARTPRESTTKDPKEVAEIRTDLRGREPLAPNDNRQLRVVSPPRDKSNEDKPVKGILRKPREQFPEDPSPIREGVAPLKDAKKDGVPPDARWTKISRKLVNPAALEAGKERFETREDFVIVLRVLSRDEVQGYAEVTQKIRGMFF